MGVLLNRALVSMNAMCVLIRRIHLSWAILCGLVVCCSTLASAAAPRHGVNDLGALGKTYSFSIDLDVEDTTVGHAFAAGNAVRQAGLTRVSGGSYIFGGPGGAHGLVIGTDHIERGVGYVYRAHGAVELTIMPSTPGSTHTDTGMPDAVYSYTRDTSNHLWWAAPHHRQPD